MTDRGTNTLAAHGLEELFFQLCCCVSFWFWREIGFGFTYLCTQSTMQLWCCVSFLVLVGNSFWCYVRVQYSCAVVSIFWLWREIVLNMRTRFYKKSYWVTLLWSDSRCVYFIQPNTLLLCIFLFCIFLLYHADLEVEVQIKILLKEKYWKSCQKCKHRQSHFDFLNNAYWVSLF